MRFEHKQPLADLAACGRSLGFILSVAMIGVCLQVRNTRAEAIWGVAGHFLNRHAFFEQFPDHWGVERTLPILMETKIAWVRDAVFAFTNPRRALLVGKRLDPAIAKTVREKRRLVDSYLSAYDKAGIKLVLTVLAYRPLTEDDQRYDAEYFDWIAELSARHPCVVAIEMHNEPNLPQFWRGTPEEYVELYRDASARIRSRAPKVKIVVGAVANLWWPPAMKWWEGVLEHGLLDYADAVSVHPYNGTKPPEVDPFFKGASSPNASFEEAIQAFWEFIENHNRSNRKIALYFTEFGYSTSNRGQFVVTDEVKQADYLSRLMMICQDVRLRGVPLQAVFWYDFKDDGTDGQNEQDNFGLLSYDLSRLKSAFFAYQAIASFFTDIDDLRFVDDIVNVADHGSAVMTKVWQRKSDGALIIVYWRLDQVASAAGDFDTMLKIVAPVGRTLASVSAHTASAAAPCKAAVSVEGGTVNVPTHITSRASWITLHFK